MNNLPQCASINDTADRPMDIPPTNNEADKDSISASSVEQPASLKTVEEQDIRTLLEKFGGNRKQVADVLGVSERTIYRKLKSLGIN